MSKEIKKVEDGTQNFGEAIRNTFKNNRQYYNDFIAPYLVDKDMEYLNIGKNEVNSNLRKNVIDIYKEINSLDIQKQRDINNTIEQGGPKSVSGYAALPVPTGVDETNQTFLMDKKGSKIYLNAISTLPKDIKDNPDKYMMRQIGAVNKSDWKTKNQDITDLQKEMRDADYILPTYYMPKRNDNGTYSMIFTTYRYPAKANQKSIPCRTIEVVLNNPTQIGGTDGRGGAALFLEMAGYPVQAERVRNTQLEKEIKLNKDKSEFKITPYPQWYEFTIKKSDKGWEIFKPDGTPVQYADGTRVGSLLDIEDVINEMYGLRFGVKARLNAINNGNQ